MEKIFGYILHLGERFSAILHTVQGWIAALVLLIADYIAGHEFAVGLVVAITIMDAVWGIAVSIKRGKFALSELARLTVAKFAVYGCAMLTFIGIDRIIDADITTAAIATVITLVEFWSSCGSMLILYPNLPALRLLKKALIGEIASKLHIPEEEVEKVLAEFDKSKRKKKT
jgi:hypothetical protein